MNIKWFKKFKTQKEKDEFRERALANREVFELLRDILQEELDASMREQRKKEHYLMPAWSEFQADMNGEQRALRRVIDLLPLKE